MLGCAWPRGKSNATGNWLSALLPFVGGRARRREKLAHRQLWSWRGPQPKKSPGEGQRHWRHPTLADVTVRSIRRSFLGFPSVVVLPLLAVVPLLALPLVAPISLTVVLLPSVLTALSAAGFLPAAGSHLPPHNLPRQISRPERRRKCRASSHCPPRMFRAHKIFEALRRARRRYPGRPARASSPRGGAGSPSPRPPSESGCRRACQACS
jgi:hypothetical protein